MTILSTRRSVLAAACLAPLLSRTASGHAEALSGPDITLRIARQDLVVDGKPTRAIGINGQVPGPLLRLREGSDATITVINDLDEDSSIHWHGLLVPSVMDGVPGISFPGIPAGGRFTYRFRVRQSGTYWYHSHSGFQEQLGLYGPLVIDPAGADPVAYDREHVIVLSDHSAMSPDAIMTRLKQAPDSFNFQKQTLAGLARGRGLDAGARLRWAGMRMSPTDIADVTGAVYTYLVNGQGPQQNWTGLFTPGERVRLRLINASSMTIFDVRIPGLAMSVVQADGQDVRPVETDEIQIGVAETYDVIVHPADRAYTLVAEGIDRSGMAVATLAPRAGMRADAPPLRARPLLTMQDMGMGGMPGMAMSPRKDAPALGPGVQMVAMMPKDRTGEPGLGLRDVNHRVLVYRDLVARDDNPDVRAPSRSLDIHLTGNMERYMWSFDGVKMSDDPAPIPFRLGERVRVRLINDTMMGHPIHLHGHFFELVTGHGGHAPRKHTVLVQPGGTVTFDLTADNPGDWAFHCHLLYHMHAGMMRVVSVRPEVA
ncbi:FtsP/CotA-like multicopper oxidase with cupredoxin domain [Endobacter medicaginis]|uniref:Copper resistance system multicopper oxidase n=1 Tax=Endobacter medicaginis TaxID=1181271 RepID=A0A839UV95_9PROT|nr:copper resistance system multicopper oxidase [Endobacter medicaginis]MBB3172324.1 FtsP/CotA-like multicopper oxidase with cupredoxin domain [Endobacter medicaginis]MCX5474557.1 copper resistance system multicopper oxidase [Endobacter medicaginis]NVN30701.1 copper resistance system multicopper oxidase [Endobacter medicaginis]